MDTFGSNATPMGGSAGRADALIGAVEAQKAEGVLHVHMFIYLQMASQFRTLHELADLFRRRLLSVEAVKKFVSYVRCAEYPDVENLSRSVPASNSLGLLMQQMTRLPGCPVFSGMRRI